jgi:hypothetical protein
MSDILVNHLCRLKIESDPGQCPGEHLMSLGCSKQTDLIIMDFAKAFDKVPHCRLLYKLKFYGIQKDISNWIKAFLYERTQTVVINGF